MAGAPGTWRIDELARRAGVTVDTIRYYVREGLLPQPERSGRHKVYGPEHLQRLERIRDLQGRRFSLAAIKALLAEAEHPGLAEVFGREEHEYTLDELVARAGVDRGLVDELGTVGLLPDPEDVGRETYDDSDLRLLQAVVELLVIGMPPSAIVELGGIYVRHFRALQEDVHAVFAGTSADWDPEELTALQRRLTANVDRMIPAVDQVLNYTHQRMAQRLTLDAVRRAAETGTGIGGIPVDG